MSRLQPSRAFGEGRPRLTIGLVNNMPDSALVATERQFGALLRAARPELEIELRLFSFRRIERGERVAEHMRGLYDDAGALPHAGLDGLIVTGAEPRAAELADEPYWAELTRVVDWAETTGTPTIWSCLAAHAAVLHQSRVRRRRLGAKRSGVFACQRVGDDPLLDGAPYPIFTPHSRYNDLREDELVGAGYEILTGSPVAGVDSFARRGASLGLFFQGHPEYEADTLMREYLRDVGRFLRRERPDHPTTPTGYFDAETEAGLAALAEQSRRKPVAATIEAYANRLEDVVPSPIWRASATQMVGAWLREIDRAAFVDRGATRAARLIAAG